MGIPIRHPLIDEITQHAVRIDSRSPVVRLSPPLSDLLTRSPLGGRRFVIVTPETSRLTVGLRSALLAAGGVWAVSTATGFRDGITGVDHDSIDSVAAGSVSTLEAVVRGSSRASSTVAPDAMSPQLSIDVTVLHSQSHDTLLGGALETLAAAVGGSPPTAWGRSEPLEHRWDRWVLTQDARHRAPEVSRILVEGPSLSAVVTTRVTERGIEETMALTVDVPGGEAGLDRAIDRVNVALVDVTHDFEPTFALVLARLGETDRCVRPVEYPAPNPVVLLIGAPSVERLDLHERAFADDQDVVVVGEPEHPAYLLPLGSAAHPGWDRLHDALDSVGGARLATLVEEPLLEAWEDDLHGDIDLAGEPHPHDAEHNDLRQTPPDDDGIPHAP